VVGAEQRSPFGLGFFPVLRRRSLAMCDKRNTREVEPNT
jgi:hypothetical protein